MIDVSDRVEAEARAKRPEEQAQASLEGCVVGIARIGLDGRWLAMNHRCLEIIGYEPDEFFDKSFRDISLAKHRDQDPAAFAKMTEGKERQLILERQIIKRDGTRMWVELKISLVRNDNGTPSFFTAVFDDIAERKEAEESLQFALEASRRINEAKMKLENQRNNRLIKRVLKPAISNAI